MQVLNFYSTVFADQMKRGRKTATIRLGDKRHKYRKNQVVLVTVGYQYSPREKLFHAVIDNVEVKRVKDLSPRDIEHALGAAGAVVEQVGAPGVYFLARDGIPGLHFPAAEIRRSRRGRR